jgi:flavin-dependent dehydrogenase
MATEDVVIIGAGIAGLTTAKWLSSWGISPLVVESGNSTSTKACGEGIHAREVDGLDFMNLYESKKGILRKANKCDFFFGKSKAEFNYEIFMVDKISVQDELMHQAKKNGARFKFDTKVTEIKREGNKLLLNPQGIKAKLVIGCDGYYSVCRGFLKQKIDESAFAVSGYIKKRSSKMEINYILGVFLREIDAMWE